VSNIEAAPDRSVVGGPRPRGTAPLAEPTENSCGDDDAPGIGIEVIAPREVPLGGIRAMPVRRTLPAHDRSMVGAWCFADHYGPDQVAQTGGMRVLPHPHTGLQTVSWLFEGKIEHRDSGGVHALVLPGEINLMSAGHGIAHSEVSTTDTSTLHGVQLWVALPDSTRDGRRGFQHHVPSTVDLADDRSGDIGGTAKVFIGRFAGDQSPIETETPLLGVELVVQPGARLTLTLVPSFEHGLLLDTDALVLGDTSLARGDLGYVGTGAEQLPVHNPTSRPARAILLGGVPFAESIVMWWNFVGRSHDDIVEFRMEWQARSERFGTVQGWSATDWIPAPPLPATRLKPRRRSPE